MNSIITLKFCFLVEVNFKMFQNSCLFRLNWLNFRTLNVVSLCTQTAINLQFKRTCFFDRINVARTWSKRFQKNNCLHTYFLIHNLKLMMMHSTSRVIAGELNLSSRFSCFDDNLFPELRNRPSSHSFFLIAGKKTPTSRNFAHFLQIPRFF